MRPESRTPPVVLFVYNRLQTTARVLKALQAQSVQLPGLIVFADGPKEAQDESGVESVRRAIRSVDWVPVDLVVRDTNLGCAGNIVQGLDSVFAAHGQAIVVEDDVLPAGHFVEALTVLLVRYRDEPAVFSVGGYPSLLTDALPGYPFDAIISPRFSVWGWGTWADRWKTISPGILRFSNPFSSVEEVPELAGADLRGAVGLIEARPGFYWDYPIALLCLHRRLVHVLTRKYLVDNIGRTTRTRGAVVHDNAEFYARHNRVEDSVPTVLPPSKLEPIVCAAVLDYLAAVWAATEIRPQPERRTRSILRAIIRRLSARHS